MDERKVEAVCSWTTPTTIKKLVRFLGLVNLCLKYTFPLVAWEQSSLNSRGNLPDSIHVPFFSRKLSPAEQNYDIGNRGLLAIKLVLEEVWLEGAHIQFSKQTSSIILVKLFD